MFDVQHLELEHGLRVAYRQITFKSPTSVVFFGGYASSMSGSRASALFDYCVTHKLSCTVFDYLGHGLSDKAFAECTLSDWFLSCCKIVESVVPEGPVVIVGCSMGGWLMLLAAIMYKDRIKGLVGIAPAPDFTERFSNETREAALADGEVTIYIDDERSVIVTGNLLRDGKNHLLLDKEYIPITCPVRLLHGMDDKIVDYTVSLDIAKKVQSADVVVHLVKSVGHDIGNENSWDVVVSYLEEVLRKAHA